MKQVWLVLFSLLLLPALALGQGGTPFTAHLNAGGPDLLDASGTLWRADTNPIFGLSGTSSTYSITGAIVGVGSARRLSAVRWGVARRVVWAWVLTIPGSAVMAAVVYWLTQVFS